MDENIDERELARAPMRAHILASINPSAGTAAPSSTGEDRSRRHRSRRKRRNSDARDRNEGGRSASDNTGDDDDKLRPRKSKIRFKSRRKTSSRHGEEGEEARRRYRSREYDDDRLDEGEGDERTDEVPRAHEGDHRHESRRGRTRSQTRSTSPRDDRQHRSQRHDDERSHRTHRSHRSHHRHRQRDRETTAEMEPEDADADPPLDEDAAFRQSLFDAMADDEGAAFWEGVYGQPVHEYAEEASKYRAADASGGPNGNANDPAGLSAMTDDEYAAYVRLRMWERSDEGRRHAARKAAEERQARDKADEQAKERARQAQKAKRVDAAYWAEVDRSLQRGQARRQRKQWQERWQAYAAAWTAWERQPTADTIPWPVDSKASTTSEAKDDDKLEAYAQEVRAFFMGDDAPTETRLQTRLRDERVRWHPDKMQQRLGGSVDADAMRKITAIFQVVDTLWGELRRRR